jgi:hypothetical protein
VLDKGFLGAHAKHKHFGSCASESTWRQVKSKYVTEIDVRVICINWTELF